MLTEASRAAGFTNERGVDGTVRYLRNVMGLWLLQESLRTWAAAGLPADLADLLAAAARVPAFTAVVDPDDPGSCRPATCRRGSPRPAPRPGRRRRRARPRRSAASSTAWRWPTGARCAGPRELSGRTVEVVHVVGGGARNTLLCQLTADACGLPVLAGPVEAAALGNALVQARAGGVLAAAWPSCARCCGAPRTCVCYLPTPGAEAAWRAAEERLAAG